MNINWFDLWYRHTHPTSYIIDWWFNRQEGPWKCSVCNEFLVPGEKQEFETLDEHVSDPNKEEYPLRDTWVCPNEKCIVHTNKSFFADGGSLFGGGKEMFKIPYHAPGSWQWTYERRKAFTETKIGLALTLPASRLWRALCYLGVHLPRETAYNEMYCGGCKKDLKHPLFRKHPLFHSYISWSDQIKLPLWKRIWRGLV